MPESPRTTILVVVGALGGVIVGAALRPGAATGSSAAALGPLADAGAVGTAASVTASASPSVGAQRDEAAPVRVAPSSSVERAAAGDLDALKAIELVAEAERSIEMDQALAEGHAALARNDLAALVLDVAREPRLAHDRATLARFYAFVEHEPIAIEALGAVARLPGPESWDLLYAIWRRHQHTTVGLFARDLVRRRDVRYRVGEPLRVALDLEAMIESHAFGDPAIAARCEQTRELLVRVTSAGDHRCVELLTELDRLRTCGRDARQDCYPCVHADELLEAPRQAARARAAPTPWLLAGKRP